MCLCYALAVPNTPCSHLASLVVAIICRFDATELRGRAKKYTQWPDMPHLDKAFIAMNMQHLLSLGLIQASAKS